MMTNRFPIADRSGLMLAIAIGVYACGSGGVPDDVPYAPNTGDDSASGINRGSGFGAGVNVPGNIPGDGAGGVGGVGGTAGNFGDGADGDGAGGAGGVTGATAGFGGTAGFSGTAGFGAAGAGAAGFGAGGVGASGFGGIGGNAGFGAAGVGGAGAAGTGTGNNGTPLASMTITPQCVADLQTEVTLVSTSTDPDGDGLRCIWTMPAGIPNGAEGCVVQGVTFLFSGESEITLFVDDGRGGTSTATRQFGPCSNLARGVPADVPQ